MSRAQVLIIHGEHDKLVPLANSRRLAAKIPNCQLEILPNCGHQPHEEHPEQFVEIVREWLDGA